MRLPQLLPSAIASHTKPPSSQGSTGTDTVVLVEVGGPQAPQMAGYSPATIALEASKSPMCTFCDTHWMRLPQLLPSAIASHTEPPSSQGSTGTDTVVLVEVGGPQAPQTAGYSAATMALEANKSPMCTFCDTHWMRLPQLLPSAI